NPRNANTGAELSALDVRLAKTHFPHKDFFVWLVHQYRSFWKNAGSAVGNLSKFRTRLLDLYSHEMAEFLALLKEALTSSTTSRPDYREPFTKAEIKQRKALIQQHRTSCSPIDHVEAIHQQRIFDWHPRRA